MRLLFILFFVFFNIDELFSQWNVQLGHEYGVSKVVYTSTPLGEDNQNNRLSRTSISGEYLLKNGLLFGMNGGVEWHIINYDYSRKSTFSGMPSTDSRNFIGTIQNYRVGISTGYLFNINEKSQFGLKLSYDLFLVNKISIKESNHTIQATNESQNHPEILVEEYDPLIDVEEIGFRNEFKKQNRSFALSLSYRLLINSVFVVPSITYSYYDNVMWSNPSLIAKANHNYLIGISLGYTFPQNSEKHEK